MEYKNGEYKHACKFNLCNREFYGRLNKAYCSLACKKAYNNRKSSIINNATKGYNLSIRLANQILMKIFKSDNEGKFVISKLKLKSYKFPFDLPTTLIKDDRHDGRLNCFGSYSFYQKGEDFIFYKIK